MKSIATAFTAIALVLGTATQAEAREHCREAYHGSSIYISGRASCGTPIYTERYVVHVDRRGHAVWGTRVLPVSYHHGRGGYGGYRSGYGRGYGRGGYGGDRCEPSRGRSHRGGSPVRDLHDAHRDFVKRILR